MYVKHRIGARRGETEDLPFEIAKEKVLRGDAEDVFNQLGIKAADVPQPAVVSSRADVTVTKATKPEKSRRR